MEELRKQLSTELNKPITIYEVEGSWIRVEGDDNKYCMNSRTAVLHRYLPTNILKNELLFWIEDPNIHIFCNSKCDITTIIQLYNQTKEYKNNLDKEFNLDCFITTFYDDNNLIDEVIIYISTQDDNISEYIEPVYAKTYLECYEKINKIITLKNELLSKYGTIEESHYESKFVVNIDNNDTNILEFTLYNGDILEQDRIFRITISTNKLVIYEVYNQFKYYINSFIEKYDNDDCFHDLYVESSIYIDMSYNDNNSNVYVKIANEYNPQITLTIKCETKNIDFRSITEIYNEVINYIEECYRKIGSRLNKTTEINVIYNSNKLVNICATYNMNNICADNYIGFTEKLEVIIFEQKKLYEEEYRLKKELEKQKLEQERIIKEQEIIEEDKKRYEEHIRKINLELSTQLKENIVIKESMTSNSFIILGEGTNKENKIKININCFYMTNGEWKLSDIAHFINREWRIVDISKVDIDICKIYNEVKTYKNNNDLHKVYQFDLYIDTTYYNNNINKITLKWDDNEISAQHYFECNQKIAEYIKLNEITLTQKLALKIKEEQEKFTTKLKLKYGDKTVLTKRNDYSELPDSYNSITSIINVEISNVDTEHIDLLDIIHNYSGNKIVNGFIRQTNCANYAKYINSDIEESIFNITIQNCPNLKIINNIIDFENNAHLKICNCPRLEFIQNYNNFSEIYIDHHRVKIYNE